MFYFATDFPAERKSDLPLRTKTSKVRTSVVRLVDLPRLFLMAVVLCNSTATSRPLHAQTAHEQSMLPSDRMTKSDSEMQEFLPPIVLSLDGGGFGGVTHAAHQAHGALVPDDHLKQLQYFAIDDLMQRARLETGCSEADAASQVLACIPTAYRFWEAIPAVTTRNLPVGFSGGTSPGADPARAAIDHAPIAIKNQQLCVHGSARELQLVSRGLSFLRTHGFVQLVVEIEIYSFPDRYVNQFATDLGQVSLASDTKAKQLAADFAMAKDKETLLSAMESLRKRKPKSFRLVAAPRFRAWNGQAVEMKSGTEQSFVTSYQWIQDEQGEPQLRPVHTRILNGIALNLIATTTDKAAELGGPKFSVQLRFHQSKVEDVSSYSYAIKERSGTASSGIDSTGPKQVTIEQPSVQKTGFNSAFILGQDQLLVAMLNEGPEAGLASLLVADCRLIPAPKIAKKR